MNRSLFLFLLFSVFFFAACRKVPDHARYIPKSAISVVGINTGTIGKKIAWSALTGTDITSSFDSFALRQGYNIKAEDLRNSGMDLSSTIYMYFVGSGKLTAGASKAETVTIVPLESTEKWSAFLKKAFPRMQTLNASSGKAAQLDSSLVVLWTDKVAFLSNPTRSAGSYVMLPDSTEEWQDGVPDMVATLAKMETLPKITKEEALVGDNRFSLLAKSDHDMIAWMNYEQMLGGTGGAAASLGLLSNKLYKDMALTTTVDFKDGKAEAEIWYYTSGELQDAGRKMGSGSLPKEMIARLPKENMDGFGALNFPTESLKMLLEKMGMIGLLNMGLAAQGLSIDDIVGAIPGDMAFSVNNYKSVLVSPLDSLYAPYNASHPEMDYVFALKLGKKEKVAKIMQFLLARKLLTQVSPKVYVPFGNTEAGGVLVLDENYAVAARTEQMAQNYLSGRAPRTLSVHGKEAVGNGPLAFFIDFQQIMKGMDTNHISQARDRWMWLESQRLFSHLTVCGGSFNSDHLAYTTHLELLNQKENALLQLLRFSNRMTQIDRDYPVNYAPQSFDTADSTIVSPNPVF